MLGLLTIGSYLEDLPPFFYLFYCKKNKAFLDLNLKDYSVNGPNFQINVMFSLELRKIVI